MQLAADIFWSVWLVMLIVGDPVFIKLGGEKASDTHFIVTHISVGLRAGVLGWLIWHFLVTHVRS